MKVTKVRQFSGHKQSIYSICRGGNESFFSAGSDGLVVSWNLSEDLGQVLATMPEPLFCMGFSLQHQLLAVGSRQGNIYLINLLNRSLHAQWQGHHKAIFELYFEAGNTLLSISEDGMLKRWQLDGQAVSEHQISTKSLRSLIEDEAGYFISASDGRIYLSDKKTLAVIALPCAHESSVFSCVVHQNNLISAGREAKIRLWSLKDQSLQKEVNAHWYSIHHLSLSKNNRYLLSGSMDKTIRIWNPLDLSPYKTIDFLKDQGHTSSVNRLIWVDDERFLSCSDDRQIMLWKIEQN